MNNRSVYFNFYALLVIFTPLIFVNNTGELFEFPKTFFIYFASLIALLIYLVDAVVASKNLNQFFKELKRPSLIVQTFMVTFIFSTIFSSHLYTSVWGYYTRFNDGLLSVLAFFVLYFVAVNKLTKQDFTQLTEIMLLPLLPIALFGIAQHFGFINGGVWFGGKVDRVYSTMGQPNWLAQYLVCLLPIALIKVFNDQKVYIWLPAFILGYLCLVFTYSLSGFLAFGVTYALGLYYLIKRFGFNKLKVKLGLLTLFIVMSPLVFPGLLQARLHDLMQDLLGENVSLVYAQANPLPQDPKKYALSDAGFIRKYAWRGTLQLIFSSPKNLFIGTGPETFPYAFQPYRPKELNYSSEWSFLFNKPHNYYLEEWAESGILGLLSYLLVLGYLFKKLSYDKKIALLGFAITNIFGWPVVATALIFWFWLAEVEVETNE